MTRPAGIDRRSFLGLGAGALASTLPPTSTRPGSIRQMAAKTWIPNAAVRAGLPRAMDVASVPGMAIAVVEEGAVAWQEVYGVANASTGAPVSPESVFPAASLGKAVFGYAVLRLVDAGTLSLDRPLVEYHRPADLPSDPRLDRITARHVLSHTTGLRNWRNRVDQPLVPDFEPGERFQYSGEGFYWLQQVVEKLSSQGIDRFMRTTLFDPAGMKSASYGWSEELALSTVYGHGNRGQVGFQYSRTLGGKLLPVAARWGKPIPDWNSADTFRAVAEADSSLTPLPNSMVPNVAGSFLATVGDYARFLTLLMSGRRRADWEIGEATRRAMLTSRVALKPTLAWGLGVGLETTATGPFFWHWGDNGVFRAFMVGDPARRRAIVIFTNADSGPRIYQRVIRGIGLDLDAFLWV